mmetsp:Transcript_13758/g.32042  ORF Transcript_13758/g.32042 Transcript_13758/m.32042 type:complete len:277 (+) Transcript_13758:58-888(+)
MAHLTMPREGTVRTSGDNVWLFTDRTTFKLSPGQPGGSVGGCQWTIMPMSELIYFEVVVLADKGALSIGVAPKNTPLRGHTGAEGIKSFGWTSKGDLLDKGKAGERLGPFTTGDIVGLGYNETGENVYWTKNGKLVETIRPVSKSFGELVPTITLEGNGSAARFNFSGDFDFKVKGEASRGGERRRMTPLPPSLGKPGSGRAQTAGAKRPDKDELGPHLRCRAHKKVKLLRDKCSFTEFSKLEKGSPSTPGTSQEGRGEYIVVQVPDHTRLTRRTE